jgi:hypothetical protein
LQRLLADPHLSRPSPPYHVDALAVMKSDLARTGARYSAIREVPFGR